MNYTKAVLLTKKYLDKKGEPCKLITTQNGGMSSSEFNSGVKGEYLNGEFDVNFSILNQGGVDKLKSEIDGQIILTFWEKTYKGKFEPTEEIEEFIDSLSEEERGEIGYGEGCYGEEEEKKTVGTDADDIDPEEGQDSDYITLQGYIDSPFDANSNEIGVKIGDQLIVIELTEEVKKQLTVQKSDERRERESEEIEEELKQKYIDAGFDAEDLPLLQKIFANDNTEE